MGTLKGWGSSYLVSYYLEVLICTQQSLGLQSLAPATRLALASNREPRRRGQEKGDALGKINLAKNKKSLLNNNLTKNRQLTIANSMWVGVLVAFSLLVGSFSYIPKAYAADPVMDKVEIAKKVIENVSANMVDGEKPKENETKFAVSEDFIQKPLVVETKITIDLPIARANYSRLYTDGANHFPYGYCTYYVAQKRTVTWSGNAGTWLTGAKAAGVDTGKTPQPGAIMVTSEGGRIGHVAYVEKIDGNKITVSEMNYKGYGIVSTRTIASNLRVIKGFIY